jgi:hypothetical protein
MQTLLAPYCKTPTGVAIFPGKDDEEVQLQRHGVYVCGHMLGMPRCKMPTGVAIFPAGTPKQECSCSSMVCMLIGTCLAMPIGLAIFSGGTPVKGVQLLQHGVHAQSAHAGHAKVQDANRRCYLPRCDTKKECSCCSTLCIYTKHILSMPSCVMCCKTPTGWQSSQVGH